MYFRLFNQHFKYVSKYLPKDLESSVVLFWSRRSNRSSSDIPNSSTFILNFVSYEISFITNNNIYFFQIQSVLTTEFRKLIYFHSHKTESWEIKDGHSVFSSVLLTEWTSGFTAISRQNNKFCRRAFCFDSRLLWIWIYSNIEAK